MYPNKSIAPWQRLLALCALFTNLTVAFTACWDEENPTLPPPSNITQAVVSGRNFTLLEAAVTRAGLASTLSGAGPFTVFAPTDDAFRAAGLGDVNTINNTDQNALRNILLYHVASGSVSSSAVTATQTSLPTSASGNAPIFVTRTASGSVTVNNARVVTADIGATNGVIHAIDRVLMPPAGNILQIVVADPNLTFLEAAAIRGGATVTGALSGNTPLTVFAPTDDAFRAAGFPNIDAINAAPIPTLTAVLTNHVIAGARAYSPTLVNGPITTFGGGSLTVATGANGVTILSRGNGTNAARVTTADINATNGVIHKIDRVLLP